MKRSSVIAYTVVGLAIAGTLAYVAPSVITAATTASRAQPTAQGTPESTPRPTPTPDSDRVISLGDGVSVKVSDLPKGCTTYSKIQIFDVSGHSYGRLIGDAADRGPSDGATGTVNRDTAGNIVSYTAAPGDQSWTIGDRLCTNPLMLARYNHIGSDRGDHTLQPDETVVVRPDMNVEWVPAP